jgi:hypothetical protein
MGNAEAMVYYILPTPDTSHREMFAAYGTAGKSHFEVQALSGDIPARGGHSWI